MLALTLVALMAAAAAPSPLETARDQQDRATLERMLTESAAAASKAPNDAEAQYRAALAASYLAGVDVELHEKKPAHDVADRGIPFAEKAVSLKPDNGEYLRVLGTLYGQAVSDLMSGLRYGAKAKDTLTKAVEKSPKSSMVYVARGVGNLFLPAQLGGGPSVAIPDFQKALELDPRNAEAYVYMGLSLRDEKKIPEARQAFTKALELNPKRLWAKQQLDKTPAK
ncbi:MAG TPA: tetratricopeptide repeat protein [Candidatus Sulfopaludibacter sp.]|jgi:tetratricopeptide (TPR) repeat protein|nr:tetratricopeptide repeat protein [Candidatus Sulfopaludibacter sp.]